MTRLFSSLYVNPNSIIQIDGTEDKYKVKMCIDLSYFGKSGYQLNLVRV